MSFPRYSKYCQSSTDDIGAIPVGWATTPLKRLAEVDSSGCYGIDPDEADIVLPVATTAQIDVDGRFVVEEMPLRGFTQDEVDRYLCSDGDILIVKSSGSATNIISGKAGLVVAETPSFIFSNFLMRIRPSPEIALPSFIYSVLRSHLTRQRVEQMCSTTTYPNLQVSEYSSALLPVPPLDEQKAIASFLDAETSKIDALVAEQRRLIELLKEKRQAVISHAVTKGLNPDAPMKPSGIEWLGEVPAHWEVKPLKYLASFRSGGTPSKKVTAYWHGDVPWASSKDLKTETLADTIDHITEYALESDAATLVPAGSVMVVVRGMILLHTFPVVHALVPMAINQDLKALTPTKCIRESYLPWLLRGSIDATFSRVDEAAHGTKVLRMEAWVSIQLPVPPLGEQLQIVASLETKLEILNVLQTEANRAIELLLERRTALISAAVTGKIDVRNFADQEAP